ncbi:MAG: phage portal protein [Solirubrobacteraceae bacterium]
MGLTIITAAGEVIDADDNAGPFQVTPEGFNSGLSTNSVPFAQWEAGGATASYAHLYATQPWVYIAVNFITRQISRLPLKAYSRDSQGVKRPLKEGTLYDALQQPNHRKGPIHLKQWMAFPTLLHGTGTVHKLRDRAGGPATRFAPLDWRCMQPKRDRDGIVTHWIYSGLRDPIVVLPDDLLLTAWDSPDGEIGVSPLRALGITTRLERHAQVWMDAHFRNSARPSGGITMPEAAAGDIELRKELREDLERLHMGGPNNGRPMLMPPGGNWVPFGQTAHEVELIDQRKLNREEVAAGYNAPQPLIGILDHATYSNVAELHKILYGPVLGPWLVLFEETFKAHVLDGEPEYDGQWVEFDLAEVLRGDILKESLALKNQLQIGLLTINEARQIRNLPPIDHPDCNRPMIPTNNMTFIGGQASADDATSTVLSRSMARVGNRLYRKARAGEDGWDAGRFHRELLTDLEEAGVDEPARVAQAWTGAVGAIVADALNEPDVLRASFAALIKTKEPNA